MEDDLDVKRKQLLDAKLEKMKQDHDLDMEKLRWEKEKFLLTQKAEAKKWEKIQQIFSPIFQKPETQEKIEKPLKKPLRKQRKK